MSSPQPRRKILFLGTDDMAFWLHRLPLARAAKAAGYEVVVASKVSAYGERIRREGYLLLPLPWKRGSFNPARELLMIARIIRLYRSQRPDIVHHVAAKSIIYGSLAARICGVPAVVNALTGLGFVFVSRSWKARLLKPLVRLAFKFTFSTPGSRTVFENPEDRRLFVEQGLLRPERSLVIRGSGVDLERFPPRPEPAGAPVVILACRMLWDKGVGEFVEAARLLAEAGVKARLVLVGKGDPENPASVPESRLAAWAEEGVIEWWGRREDMPQVFAASHIVCLPSYREGLSVTLMEGAASARPLVAADVPGCRDIVRHEETGLLVPPRDGRALAAALRRLIEDAGLRARLGRNARGLAIAEFAEQKAVRRMLLLYEDELGGRPGSSGSRP